MDKYENLGIVGEGSYGMVLKCKHKDTNQIVAIKKFLESEDDKLVKKIAFREIKMLKMLRHDHLVNLIEVFRRRKRLYLVFEFMDHTILDELEKFPQGLDEMFVRKILWQVLKGIEFCHSLNIIHRDIKPENILISKSGIVKVCDFGFARTITPGPGEPYTDYVATRWYRAPELLVGDTKYGKAVDTWAVGCLIGEMLCGDPLFPGDSDIDQLYHIIKCIGNLIPHHKEVFSKNPIFSGAKIPEVQKSQTLHTRFPKSSEDAKSFMEECLRLDPSHRPTCSQLLKKDFIHRDSFYAKFSQEIRAKIQRENQNGPMQKIQKSMDIIKQEEKKRKQKEREREQKEKENNYKGKRKNVDQDKLSILPQMDQTSENNRTCSQIQDGGIVSSDFLSANVDIMPPINYTPMTQLNLQSKSDEKCLKRSPRDKVKQFSKLTDTPRKGQEKNIISDSKKSKSRESDRKDSFILPKVESNAENGRTREKNLEKGPIGSTAHVMPFDPSKYQDTSIGTGTKGINLPSVI